jgi:beta-glucanase (GH16 family)
MTDVAASLSADGSELPLAAPKVGNAPADAVVSALASAQMADGGLAVLNKWVGSNGQGLDIAIYDRDGKLVANQEVAFSRAVEGGALIALAGGGVAVGWQTSTGAQAQSGFAVYSAAGALAGSASVAQPGVPSGFALPTGGFQMTWGGGTHVYAADGSATSIAPLATPIEFAMAGGGAYLQLQDNQLSWFDGSAFAPAVTLPGEAAHAVTSAAITHLSGGDMGLVWTDAQGAHTAVFHTASHTLSAPVLIDAGASSAAAITALPDGGFAASWQEGGMQKGEAFNADGQFGPSLYLDGAVAGTTSSGELYTVTHTADGGFAEQHYALAHAAPSPPPPEYDNYLGQAMPQSAGNFDDVTHSLHSPAQGGQTIYAPVPGPSGVAANGGNNTIIAANGDETYYISASDTVVVPDGTTGTKTIWAWNAEVLPQGVNNLIFFGAGNWGIGNTLDNLIQMGGNDTSYMDGGAGNDVLVGGFGKNNFGVSAGNGNDVIYNFHPWYDTVRMPGTSFTSFSQVQAAMTQVGSDVVLQLDPSETLTFRGLSVGDFQASDFLLPLDASKLGGLTFGDDFNSISLLDPNTGAGTWRTSFIGDPNQLTTYEITNNQEQQVYTDANFKGTGSQPLGYDPFSESDGVLSITAKPFTYADSQSAWGQPYSSGMINTAGLFAQQYGYFEMKAELPTAAGTWPAFWLAQQPFIPGTEADILEHLAMYPNVSYARSDDNGYVLGSSYYNPDPSGFHTYGMLWTATTTTFYVDQLAVMQINTPTSWDKPMAMIINLALGGWGGPVDVNGLPAQMNIDYVHVYGLADGSQIVQSTTAADGYVSISADTYIAPAGVKQITLSGSGQTVTGNDTGDVFISNNTGNHLNGGAGNDTFQLGRTGDIVSSGGGVDTFAYSQTPWAGGVIAGFAGGDKLDISQLLSNVGYTGSTPVADGYLKVDANGAGDAQVWVNQDPGGPNDGWWLLDTLTGVKVADLQVQGDAVVGIGPPAPGQGHPPQGESVSTSAATYQAPAGVSTITLTGSASQSVTGNNAGDVFFSNNNANHLTGGSGADTFHIGRAGDVVASGGGTDVFAFAETPWSGAQISGFGGQDSVDLTGLLAKSGYVGSDPVADGYIKVTDDGAGNAQVWSDMNAPGNNGWWLVATLKGVAASGLQVSGDFITQTGVAPPTSGGGGGGTTPPSGSAVSTSDPTYAAPPGVTHITLTGASAQAVRGNNDGDIFDSNNNGNHLTGGTGADTFHLGRGGDIVAGGAGSDVFAFAETPWAGSHITDFAAGDAIDLTGLLAKSGYTGSDPVTDGYIKLTADGSGSAQIWSDMDGPGTGSGWWLAATLDGTPLSGVQMQGDMVVSTAAPPSPPQDPSVSTSDPVYKAPSGVTHITLTGSGQTVTGNDGGDTFVSNNTGNHLTGGAGADLFDIGRGGDVVAGGAGADVFAFAETPWAGARIKDFTPGQDSIDLTGLLAKSGYHGTDAIADGYIKIVADGAGGAQVLSDMNQPGNTGWWVVATLDGVTPSSLHLHGAFITG